MNTFTHLMLIDFEYMPSIRRTPAMPYTWAIGISSVNVNV